MDTNTSEIEEFWDFLKEIDFLKTKVDESDTQVNEFSDFHKSEARKTDPNFNHSKHKGSIEKKLPSPEDSGLGESTQRSFQALQVLDDFIKDSDPSKPENSSRDTFWDFLSNKSTLEKPSESDDACWDFIYSKSNQQKPSDSDDDFWDFLKNDSPDQLQNVVKSITDSIQPTPMSDTDFTDTPMSATPFDCIPTSVETGKKIIQIEGSDAFNRIHISKDKNTSCMPFNVKDINFSPRSIKGSGYQVKEISTNGVEIRNAKPNTNINYPTSKATVNMNFPVQGENLPCHISSVFSMQSFSSGGKAVTEVIPTSTKSKVCNAIATGRNRVISKHPSVFVHEKNKVLTNTEVVTEKKTQNILLNQNKLLKPTQKIEGTNKRPLANTPLRFYVPIVRTANDSSLNSIENKAQEHKKIPSEKISSSNVPSDKVTPKPKGILQVNQNPSTGITANVNPLYFLVQGNSESFQNPNYSHYFVIVNNNLPNHPNKNQGQGLIRKVIIPNATVPTTNPKMSVSQPINVSDARQFVLPNSFRSQATNPEALRNGKSTDIKRIDQTQINSLPLSNVSTVQLTNFTNSSTASLNQQSSQKIDSLKNDGLAHFNYIPVKSILLKEPLFSSNEVSAASQTLHLSSNDPNASNGQGNSIKPIKSISLGKHKNVILQTSIPEKMKSVPDEALSSLSGNSIIMPPLNVHPRCDAHTVLPSPIDQPIQNTNTYLTAPVINYAVLSGQQTFSNGGKRPDISSTESKGLPNVSTVTNTLTLPPPVQTNATTLNISVSLPNSAQIKTNISAQVEQNKVSSMNVKLAQPNQYVQVKLAPPPNTAQGLLPVPASMVPITVVQPTLVMSQPSVSKVLVLQGQPQTDTMQWKALANNQSSGQSEPNAITKRSGIKTKKNGSKTVRQLLEEYRRKQLSNGQRLQKPILRRILKLPANITAPGGIKTLPVSGNSSYNVSNVVSNKRPNILVLPSASKHMKKNVLKDDPASKQQTFLTRELDFIGSSSIYESECDSFFSDRRDFRPRHYDMSELHIGFFKVDDDIEFTCGRFRSKFKVLFSKCQFLYDFPVSRCNRVELKSSQIWEKRARIVVPFKSIVSMDLRDRTININLSEPPSIFLGRIQARAGIISNPIVYDTQVEDSNQWGKDIKSTLMHKVILRKRQASKLKTSLCEFDESFITLTNIHEFGTPFNANAMIESNQSPNSVKKDGVKNKKLRIRRLPMWDSPEHDDDAEPKPNDDEDVSLLENQMCSCRISCRSIRCSCVKAARSCRSGSLCLCVGCDNPLNILESLGMNIEFSLSDRCLFQNIYPIPKLADFLKREMKLSCCNTIARVQDCIPGTVLCPNVDCNVQLEFSWCRGIVCYPERNPRNHCSFCGQCCFSNKRHCFTCRRCYIVSLKVPYCPTCKEMPLPFSSDIPCKSETSPFSSVSFENQNGNNSAPKPEIIILDSWTVPKTEVKKTDTPSSEVSEIEDIITIESPKKGEEDWMETHTSSSEVKHSDVSEFEDIITIESPKKGEEDLMETHTSSSEVKHSEVSEIEGKITIESPKEEDLMETHTPSSEVKHSEVIHIEDIITIESPKKEEEDLMEYAATL